MTNETRSTLGALYDSLAPAQNSAGSSNGNGGGSGSASSRRTSPLEDYYNEKRQKQAIENANEIINSDILHGGTKPVGWQQKTAQPSGTSGASTSSRGRGLVGGLRDAWLDKHPNVTTISAKDLPSANQTVYDLQQRKKELEGEKTKNARYSLVDGVLTNNNTDYDAEIADIDKRIAETKKQDDYRTVWDKLVDTVTGAVTGSAASKSDAMRTLYESGQNSRTAEYEREIAQLQKDYDRAKRDYEETLELEGEDAAQWAKNTLDDVERKLNAYKKVVDENVQQKATQATADLADQLQQDSAERIERAKDGSGAVGRFAVDAGVAATQMGIDALTGRALGIGDVGSKASMALRAFGGGTQEARQGGGDLKQQLGYGGGVAAVELITEKLFDGLAGIYGKGTLDKVAEGVIGNLAKTDAGRTALRVLAGGIGEGSEELISDALNPLLRTIYNGKTVGESYSEEQIADWGYDFLVGAVLGAGGKTVDIATGENAKKNAKLRSGEVDKAIELMTGKKAASKPQSAAETAGDITTPPTPSNDAVARPVELNSAVNNNAETQSADAQKNTATTGTENSRMSDADLQDYLAVGERQHVRNAKEAQLNSGSSPILTTISQIRSFIRSALYGEQSNTIKAYGKVGSKMAQDISAASDGKTNVSGYYLELDGNRIRHMKDHVDTDSDGRNVPLTSEQAEQLTDYIDNYDNVLDVLTRKDGSTKVYLSKATGDGHVVVVELVSKGRQSLQPVTAWQNTNEAFESIWGKKRADSASQTRQESSSRGYQSALTETSSRPELPQTKSGFTGDASAEAPASDTSIPTAEQNVNSGQAENSGSSEQRAKTNLGSKSTRAKTSQAVETLMEADITPEARQEQLNPYIKNGRFDYIPDTNKAQVRRATKKIANVGWEQAVKDFHDNVISGKSSKDLVAEGAILLNNAANSDASGRAYLDLANDFIEMAHRAGETLQAIKIVQQLSPEGRLYLMSKNVKAINESLTKGQRKAIAKKQEGSNYKNISAEDIYSNYEVKLDESLADEYMKAETEEQRDAALSKIQQNIADQIPSTFGEKWNAIRYVNMLGNFKTQIRNVGGNTLMMATQMTKNRVKAAAEVTANLFRAEDKKIERTAAFRVGKQLRAEAAADFESIKDIARGEGKYNDNAKMAKEIQDKRRIFNSNLLEAYRKATNWAMDAGDVIFLKANYADALGGWLKAHGIKSMADATPEQLDRGRAYAIKEAQEATFRDDNVVSKAVNKIGRNPITEGIIPFRKTPANVAVRAVEYSPLGIAETIYKGIQTKSGNANANDVINSLSKNVVGSTLAFAGYALAKAGFARGSEDDDDLDSFQKMQGKQDYAVKIGDKWISLSQLAPNSVPLYMGVMLYEALDGGGLTWESAYKILGCLNDPLMDMSMLSGVNDALSDVITYGDDGTMVWKVLGNAMMSYLTQGINNSLVGQAEQAWEENRQTVYSDKDSVLPSNVQYKLGKAMGKIPGVDYHQQDYVDAWGRTQSNGSAGKRIFDAFINPFYSGTDTTTKVDTELERLYKAGKNVDGFPNVLPQKAARSTEYVKGTSMTPDEYKQYSIDRGQKSLELVSDFMESDEYKIMSDIQRAGVISDLYSLAADRALKSVKTSNGIAYTGKLDDVAKLKDVPEFYASKEILSGAKDNTKENFDAIDQVLKNFGHLKDDTQTALKASELNVNPLLYAQTMGIKSKSWYDTKAAVDKAKGTLGGTDNAIAIAVYNSMKGKSDAEILDAIRAQVTPKAGGQQSAVVRRAEAYTTVAKGNADLGSWLNLVAALHNADENSKPNKDEAYAAWRSLGLRDNQTYAGITRDDFYNIVKSSGSYATKDDYATQIDEDYAKIDPAVEKEKTTFPTTPVTEETGNSKSGKTSMDDYYRALGLIK
jgi:hypothetical protein